ncbi:hypothetical protein D3C75_1071650 [compost metagenome]
MGDGPAVTTVATQHISGGDPADHFVGFLFPQFLFQKEQGAFAFTLIKYVADAVMTNVGFSSLQRSNDAEGLLPM